MQELDALYAEIDEKYPHRRKKLIKEEEKRIVGELLIGGMSSEEIMKAVDKAIERDTSYALQSELRKAIGRLSGNEPIFAQTTSFVSQPQVTVKQDEPDPIKDAFMLIWAKWPINYDFPETEEGAYRAFKSALGSWSLDDLTCLCNAYCREFGDIASGLVYPMKMKNFLNDNEVMQSWLERGRLPDIGFERRYFDAAYSHFPTFEGKKSVKAEKDSLMYYRRFIKEDMAPDFLAAVQAYASKCRERDDLDSHYIKSFIKFMTSWQDQRCEDQKMMLVHGATELVLTEEYGDSVNHNYLSRCLMTAFRAGKGCLEGITDAVGAQADDVKDRDVLKVVGKIWVQVKDKCTVIKKAE